MAKKGGIFGKIIERVTPDKQEQKDAAAKEEHGGLLGKAFDTIKDRFDGDDGQKAEGQAGNPAQEPRREQSQTSGGATTSESGTARIDAAESQPSGAGAAAAADGAAAEHGKTSGSGMGREYVTREGDTLEAIGAYFYGDPVHAQRLIDDNPQLQGLSGPLSAGMRLKVSEDASRGDAVKNTGY